MFWDKPSPNFGYTPWHIYADVSKMSFIFYTWPPYLTSAKILEPFLQISWSSSTDKDFDRKCPKKKNGIIMKARIWWCALLIFFYVSFLLLVYKTQKNITPKPFDRLWMPKSLTHSCVLYIDILVVIFTVCTVWRGPVGVAEGTVWHVSLNAVWFYIFLDFDSLVEGQFVIDYDILPQA